jgi:hypothetical protein
MYEICMCEDICATRGYNDDEGLVSVFNFHCFKSVSVNTFFYRSLIQKSSLWNMTSSNSKMQVFIYEDQYTVEDIIASPASFWMNISGMSRQTGENIMVSWFI